MKFKEFFLENLPDVFKRWYWSDLRWKYYYVNKYKLQLFWRLRKAIYCNFDISDSLIEFTFGIYKHYFETCEGSMKPWIDEEGKAHEHHFFAMPPDAEPKGIKFEEFKNIYDYINTYRVENAKKVEELHTYIYEPFKIEWIKSDRKFEGTEEEKKMFGGEELYQMRTVTDTRQINVKWSFDKLGRITLKTKEVKKSNNAYFKMETALSEKDDEFAKKIIEIRGYLWD